MKRFFSILSLLFILNSCGIHDKKKLKSTDDNINIIFSSVYDYEKISIMINDSLFLNNKFINTDRSLGIDRNSYLIIKADTIFINVIAIGSEIVIDKPFNREIKLDTILYKKKGNYIWLEFGDKLINVKQQKNKFVVE